MIRLPAHQRLLLRSSGFAILGTWAVLAGFALIGALLDQVDDFGQGDYGLEHALLFLLLQVPRRLYENFPMAAVIGAVLAIGGHAARSELVALRASGLSPVRSASVVLGLVALLSLPLMVAREALVPGFEAKGQAIKLAAMQREVTLASGAAVWAREGSEVFQARGGQRRIVDGRIVLVFEDVRVYAFDPQGRLAWLQDAEEAAYREDRGWELRDVRRTVFHGRTATLERIDAQAWATALKPGAIEAGLARPDLLPALALREQIGQLRRNALATGPLEDAFWARVAYPVATLALVFAALPFAFGQRRSGGFGMRLMVGIVFALLARLVQPMFANIAQAYGWPVVLAHLLPVVLLVAIGLIGFRRRA
ncbi:MAG: LPS export ABC transporter permease LptG [Lysobacteraceae bacterium]